ncbi:MAG: fused MFS/spermidine synthase [Verrucomicrobiaceae bacterium]|nr:fused MFS/spermidine synthase [Verrucomicrobiaceae bacterium]
MSRPSQPLYILVLSLLTLTSAFLLFQVQPVISKFILPWFGGSPGVWTTCMLFFQIVLFLGYTYAHLLGKLPRKVQAVLHASLLLAALLFLPITPEETWKPTGSEDPSGRILMLLMMTVGLPYFVLSSTSPLVQVWFTRGAAGANPWRLYALSNIGSLVALLSFPFFFEPRWDVVWLSKAWSAMFVFGMLLCLLALWMDFQRAGNVEEAHASAEAAADDHPGFGRRLLWMLLPAMASVVLLAATNHVCQDVAVIPFMWVVPLSLYLLTFIICFEHERWYARFPALWAVPALVVLFVTCTWDQLNDQSWWPDELDLMPNYLFELGWAFGAMFLACMVCHGELTRLKPSPKHLTSFYLHMSAGGALGGLFVSLVAPRLFARHSEWPGGLIAVFLLTCVVLLVLSWRVKSRAVKSALFALVGIAGASGALFMGKLGWKSTEGKIVMLRNFYGTLAVTEWSPEDPASHSRELSNGGIIHGQQNFAPEFRSDPTSYYGHATGIGKALDSLKSRADGVRVGIVGMGAGTAACYARSGDTYRFYDINPDVPRVAQKYFTYLPDLEKRGAKLEIVVSDARLALEREESQQFDVLLLDAFSGDSVPAHLLTKEAFEIYRRHMKPDGIIAVHVTNSYLRLAPLMAKTAAEVGYKTRRITTESDGGDHDSTDYMLFTNNEAFLAATEDVLPDEDELEKEAKVNARVWTDKRHDLFQILMMELE